jgi:hypothetical protein
MGVLGAVLIVIALLAIPPMVLMSGMAMAALLGWVLQSDAEDRHAGSELVDLLR